MDNKLWGIPVVADNTVPRDRIRVIYEDLDGKIREFELRLDDRLPVAKPKPAPDSQP